MMRIFGIVMSIIVFVAILTQAAGYGFMFTVSETEHAVITRFGNVQTIYSTPGLKFKSPLEAVTLFDKRLLRINVPTAAMPDKESQFLEIDAYVRYKIIDPQVFLETLRDQNTASSRIGNLAISALRAEIGLRDRRDIIGGDPITLEDGTIIVTPRVNDSGSFAREVLRQTVLQRTKTTAEKEFGVLIDDVRIKRSEFPSATEASVFQRMRTERAVQAQKLRAEGEELYLTITADVDRAVRIITADADQQANILRGQGEAMAISVLAEALEQDPEFFAFRRSLEAYGNSLKEGTTLVLSSDSELFKYLDNPNPKE
jgi:membrane protease subunit HflC